MGEVVVGGGVDVPTLCRVEGSVVVEFDACVPVAVDVHGVVGALTARGVIGIACADGVAEQVDVAPKREAAVTFALADLSMYLDVEALCGFQVGIACLHGQWIGIVATIDELDEFGLGLGELHTDVSATGVVAVVVLQKDCGCQPVVMSREVCSQRRGMVVEGALLVRERHAEYEL